MVGMPALYEVTFLPEGRIQRFPLSRDNHYVLPDGALVEVRTAPVWCRCCGQLTPGKEVESLEEAERALEQAARRRAEILSSDYFPNELGVPFSRGWLEELRRRLRWRSLRTSPPRCTICGTTEFVPLRIGGEVPHPAGRGTIRARFFAFYSPVSYNQAFFTPDGERIAHQRSSTC